MQRKLRTKPRLRKFLQYVILPAAIVVIGSGFWVGTHKIGMLSPGELSNVNRQSETLGGYVSHAEFADECGHCHTPVHCVSETNCQDCHIEIARERAMASGLHSKLPGTGRCQTCHIEHLGGEASITVFAYANIDHERLSGFSLKVHHLDYSGEPMTCESCHSQDQFMSETLDCITCHVNEDHDAFAVHLDRYGSACMDCHDGLDRYSEFDHAQVYPLEGGHTDLACEDCHADQAYLETPADCVECHAEPELHAGIFGLDCGRCHTDVAWQPAMLTAHTFQIGHSEDVVVNCETCHVGNYVTYPCYSCHSEEEMRDVHLENEITEYENCISCHPSGREGEAGLNAGLQNNPLIRLSEALRP